MYMPTVRQFVRLVSDIIGVKPGMFTETGARNWWRSLMTLSLTRVGHAIQETLTCASWFEPWHPWCHCVPSGCEQSSSSTLVESSKKIREVKERAVASELIERLNVVGYNHWRNETSSHQQSERREMNTCQSSNKASQLLLYLTKSQNLEPKHVS